MRFQYSLIVSVQQNLRKEGGGGNIGSLHKITGLAPLCQLCKVTLKISHSPHYKINPPPPIPSFPLVLVEISNLPLQPFFKNLKGRGGSDYGMPIKSNDMSATFTWGDKANWRPQNQASSATPGQLFIFPSSPMNIPLNKNCIVWIYNRT